MHRTVKRTNVATLTLAACGLWALAVVPLQAQARGPGGGPSPEQAAARIGERLELSDAQQAEVRAILEENLRARDELRRSHRDERDQLRADADARLAEVLSAEQMEELAALREERREERRERRRDCDRQPCRGPGWRAD